jgi:two-component system, LytTR family, sensor kinase
MTVEPIQTIESTANRKGPGKIWLVLGGWLLVIFLFATQWYAYDLTRRSASPYSYYLAWSSFMWALAPWVLWFVRRHPIESRSWKRSIALHVSVSVALSTLQVLVEATLGWLRLQHGLSFEGALAHYFGQHVQLYLLTYWALLAAAQFYRLHEEARGREFRAAQLEIQLSAARLQTLRSQLQPHFLFNTLQTAVALVHADPDGAEDVLLRLSELLRASLTEFRTHEVPLRKEMEFLDCYVGIQRRRFGARLRVENFIDDRVLDCAVPSLILQPLVENAIRHGVGTHKESDVIAVKAFEDENRLLLEVCNRTSSLTDTQERLLAQGIGLANTRARLQQLYGERHAMQLRNVEPRGVCVRLTIPARQLPAVTIAHPV